MNVWMKFILVGFGGMAVAGLIAWGALSNQLMNTTASVTAVSLVAKANSDRINTLFERQASIGTNVEWIRHALEKMERRQTMLDQRK